jgi:hypothetical protein
MRKFTLAGVLAVVVMAIVVAAGPASAASGGGCQLNGTAAFDGAGLTATGSSPFTYGFSGTLTNCQSTGGAPATGTVEAGGTWTDAAGAKFVEPRSTGTGGCSSSTTDGTAFVKWADGTITVMKYHTDGAAAAVSLSGTVIPSITLTGTTPDPVTGIYPTTTVTSTRYVGSGARGVLAFEANPTDCNTGVKSAGIAGVAGFGSQ